MYLARMYYLLQYRIRVLRLRARIWEAWCFAENQSNHAIMNLPAKTRPMTLLATAPAPNKSQTSPIRTHPYTHAA